MWKQSGEEVCYIFLHCCLYLKNCGMLLKRGYKYSDTTFIVLYGSWKKKPRLENKWKNEGVISTQSALFRTYFLLFVVWGTKEATTCFWLAFADNNVVAFPRKVAERIASTTLLATAVLWGWQKFILFSNRELLCAPIFLGGYYYHHHHQCTVLRKIKLYTRDCWKLIPQIFLMNKRI